MAFAKFEENRFRIDGEIAENHAILVNLTASIVVLICFISSHCHWERGEGPGAVIKTACFESRGSRFEPHSGLHVAKKQNVSSPLIIIQYCGEPP